MKNLTLTLFLVVCCFGMKAQEPTTANQFILGGSMNFISQKNAFPITILSVNSGVGGVFSNSNTNSKNTSFAFNPYFGKEINAHWLACIQLNYRFNSYKIPDVFQFNQQEPVEFSRLTKEFGFGLFARYTINPEQNFQLFLQPYAQCFILNEEVKYEGSPSQEQKANYIDAGVGFGLLYQINSRLRATLRAGGINYVGGKWEVTDPVVKRDFSSFGFSLNFSTIFIGVEMKL